MKFQLDDPDKTEVGSKLMLTNAENYSDLQRTFISRTYNIHTPRIKSAELYVGFMVFNCRNSFKIRIFYL